MTSWNVIIRKYSHIECSIICIFKIFVNSFIFISSFLPIGVFLSLKPQLNFSVISLWFTVNINYSLDITTSNDCRLICLHKNINETIFRLLITHINVKKEILVDYKCWINLIEKIKELKIINLLYKMYGIKTTFDIIYNLNKLNIIQIIFINSQ